jgi:hypothetical protein
MFDLQKQTVRMTNFNPRSELNGDARKPAADISCSAQPEDEQPGVKTVLNPAAAWPFPTCSKSEATA